MWNARVSASSHNLPHSSHNEMIHRRRVQGAVQVIYLSQNRKTSHKINHKSDVQFIDIYNK
ncbi:hypothetical protein E2D05_09210 [Salmonella enterica subsp. enterica serovar Napoli]|nr:hypothetical protein [Salmonella enterica subsp. enterica serovar Napoli]ECD2889298.1 hypothetical protein [Salmonella enterica subsp. enterica serovar Napoli]ECD2927256.1 hypothetical protein [Salmonella enterica subsp. enterica serovar Napoli]ECD4173735.1 hypothetical protein [Salmonella enterica subsp. enterica serovar Napoli]ECD5962801.1 hypothetical protein [Salmonella enterica subsp. enterica serovar Napoli]